MQEIARLKNTVKITDLKILHFYLLFPFIYVQGVITYKCSQKVGVFNQLVKGGASCKGLNVQEVVICECNFFQLCLADRFSFQPKQKQIHCPVYK